MCGGWHWAPQDGMHSTILVDTADHDVTIPLMKLGEGRTVTIVREDTTDRQVNASISGGLLMDGVPNGILPVPPGGELRLIATADGYDLTTA